MNRKIAAGTATQQRRLVLFDAPTLDEAIAQREWLTCANPVECRD